MDSRMYYPPIGQGLPRDVLASGCQLETGHPLQPLSTSERSVTVLPGLA